MSTGGLRVSGERGIAACFTVSLDLPHARVLAESFRRWHPEIPRFATSFGRARGDDEPWTAIDLAELGLGDARSFAFRWGSPEWQSASRPWLIRRLFDDGFREVWSLGGGVQVTGSIGVPLATSPIAILGERGRHGLPSLWGGRRSAETDATLDWWRSFRDGAVVSESSLFAAMATRRSIRVLDPASAPLLDFAPSTESTSPMDLSPAAAFRGRLRRRHAKAVTLSTRPEDALRRDPAATFDDGVPIPGVARRLYRQLREHAGRFGDPFRSRGQDTFRAWLNEPIDEVTDAARRVTRLWHAVWEDSPELRERFPEVLGRDRDAFVGWVTDEGWRSGEVSERFVCRRFRKPESWHVRREDLPYGVNLSGAVESEKGVGEAARSLARCLRGAAIPYATSSHHDPSSRNTSRPPFVLTEDNPFATNLVCVNASTIPEFIAVRGNSYFAGRSNVAHWVWETPEFPRQWESSIAEFDEVWTPSSFVTSALAEVSPVPVHTIPYALASDLPGEPRPRLGIPPDVFVFLLLFDFASCGERKNPHGLVRAFRRAFGGRRDVLLLLKCSQSEHRTEAWKSVLEDSRHCNVRISDAVLDRDRTLALLARADAYVSLHRSEGFGLSIAEAMSFAKPVIATGYSGNMDFMTAENSLPVEFELVSVSQPWGPYRRGYVWAEPDLDHAAERMRWVCENREAAREIGLRGRESVRVMLDPGTIGARIAARLAAFSNVRRVARA